MKLLVQPGAGAKPLLDGIEGAKEKIEIVIFRFDRTDIERALIRAAERGVFVHALIAYTNRGGEKNLRQLEMRLLAKGVTVARTADDLVRYHSKFLIIDQRELHVLAFNFTYLDMEHSRSFAVITRDAELVAEARKLFEADTKRQKYHTDHQRFIVSPVNARKQLTELIKSAKKSVLIYDPKVGDPAILKLLAEKVKAGVSVRVIGRIGSSSRLDHRELGQMRLHTRSIVCDGKLVFLGSQSLRTAELEARREVGLILHDAKIAGLISDIFEKDWNSSEQKREPAAEDSTSPVAKAAKRVAKTLTKGMPPVAKVLQGVVKEIVGNKVDVDVDPGKLEQAVMDAVKEAVEESVRDVVQEAADR